jgi:DNA-binding NarL/FixJ family response regulator
MTLDHAATLRILLVDDHASFRETAHHVLQQEGCDVVAEVATGEAAIAAAVATRPDVVLLDVGLADVDGFTVAAALAVAVPATRVVLVSCRSVADLGPDRIAASGAAGFVPKDTLSRAAIEAALAPPAAA